MELQAGVGVRGRRDARSRQVARTCVFQGEEWLLGEWRMLNCTLKAEQSRLWVDSENRAGVPGTADAGGQLGLSREGSGP